LSTRWKIVGAVVVVLIVLVGVAVITSPRQEKAVTPDESELWYTSQSKLGYTGPAIFRSIKQANGSWGAPEEIISNFAGEPTMDSAGNVYFVHHFYPASGGMIEADIYVAYKQ